MFCCRCITVQQNGKLLFAGEHCSLKHGTIEGAEVSELLLLRALLQAQSNLLSKRFGHFGSLREVVSKTSMKSKLATTLERAWKPLVLSDLGPS